MDQLLESVRKMEYIREAWNRGWNSSKLIKGLSVIGLSENWMPLTPIGLPSFPDKNRQVWVSPISRHDKTWQNRVMSSFWLHGRWFVDHGLSDYHGLSLSSIQPIKPTILWNYLVETNDNVVPDSLCLQGGREGGESAGSRVSVSVSWRLQVSNVCDGIWTYQIPAISTTLHTVSLLQVINSISKKKLLYLIFSIMWILTTLSRIVQR